MCDHLNLTVNHLKRSEDWYQQVFNFEKVEEGSYRDDRNQLIHWSIIRRENFMLCLYEEPEREMLSENDRRFHRMSHFGLRIQDREKFEGDLKNKELIKSVYGPIRYPYSTSWYISDPSGYEIEVSLWKDGKIQFGPRAQVEA